MGILKPPALKKQPTITGKDYFLDSDFSFILSLHCFTPLYPLPPLDRAAVPLISINHYFSLTSELITIGLSLLPLTESNSTVLNRFHWLRSNSPLNGENWEWKENINSIYGLPTVNHLYAVNSICFLI